MKQKTLISAVIVNITFYILHLTSFAQDIHFSQFYSSPLYLNPAMTGVFDGNYRVATSYRGQWASIANPYKTFSASLDMGLLRGEKKNGLGTGIYFYNDKAGASAMGKTLVGLSVAYNAELNQENLLSAGIMTAYVQRFISSDNLKWVNQFDGVNYNQNIPSGEQNLINNITYYDLGGGFLWTYMPSANPNIKGNAGFAFFHLNRPNESYYISASNPLSPKYILHGEIQNTLKNTNVTVIPRFFAAFQKPSKEIIAGLLIKHELGMTSKYTGFLSSSAIYFGGFYRWNDAFILNFAVDCKKNLSIGISYDINISTLSIASYGRGGGEISLIYKGFF
ncbi:MAG: PorP/SprF family type IX secretion system membrane protein [Bacteroidales bacterium]